MVVLSSFWNVWTTRLKIPAIPLLLCIASSSCLSPNTQETPASEFANKSYTIGSVNMEAAPVPNSTRVYKTVGGADLIAHIFEPDPSEDLGPAIIFFHGGGWDNGSPAQFFDQASYFSKLGMVAISFEYRTWESHQTLLKRYCHHS